MKMFDLSKIKCYCFNCGKEIDFSPEADGIIITSDKKFSCYNCFCKHWNIDPENLTISENFDII